jgi:UDP-N-acetyl-D-glucosamine dehydrogenase
MEIKEFLNKNNNNKDVVVVQGLGFVGAVMSLVVSNSSKKDYAVIGVDRKESIEIIDNINNGVFPIKSSDPKIEEYYQKSIKKGNFLATSDSSAYSYASVIIVDINLDVQKNSDSKGNLNSFNVDLNPFKNAIRTIGKNCKEDVLILVETTVPPGTCIKIVKPIIEEELIKRQLSVDKIKIGHSYERVMPGPEYINSIKNFYRVYSGIDKNSAVETEKFLKTIISTKEYPLTRLANTNATEMAKVLENSYRAMNIAFAVEWSRYAEEAGVNLYEIVTAIRMRPTHSNLMYPGIGVGGYCLTKDPLLASWAKINHFNSDSSLEQSERGVKINDKMPHYAFDFMKKAFALESIINKKILLLGVSYRSDVGDTRYSPVEPFYLNCVDSKAIVDTHDPYVQYWQEINIKVSQDLDEKLDMSWDIIVFTTAHSEYKNPKVISKISKMSNVKVLDTLGILKEKDIVELNKKNKVKVLGRGDI